MTKKELLENKVFQAMPDDTEIVFNTAVKAENCRPLMVDDLSFRSEIVGWAKRQKTEEDRMLGNADPIYRKFLVIDTKTY